MARLDPTLSSGEAPTIAVVGCGAIAEAFHIPALARHPDIRDRLILIDRDLDRAGSLAETFHASRASDALEGVLEEIDGAVLAVPPALHVPMALDCLRAGVHVLCEKPLASSSSEVRQLIEEAGATQVSIGVNNMRRLFGSSRLVKEIIDSGELGPLRSFEYFQGERFDWPAATGSYFGVAGGGRGVLSDLGAHIVDLACWWLGPDLELERYADDSRGGTEAVASVRFRAGSCQGEIHLSWLTRYRNSYRLVGESGVLEGELFDEDSVTLTDHDGRVREKRRAEKTVVAHEMLDGFLAAVAGRSPQPVSAEDVLPSIAFIENCYKRRDLLTGSWYENASVLEGEGR